MVGPSFRGVYLRLYELDYPGDVAGLVLIDPATEDRLFMMFEQKVVAIGSLTAEQLATALPSAGSIASQSRPPQTGAPFNRLPPDLYQLRVKLDQRLIASLGSSVSADVNRESAEGQRAALALLLASRAGQEHPIGDRPLIVLTRGQEMTPGIADNHAAVARLRRTGVTA